MTRSSSPSAGWWISRLRRGWVKGSLQLRLTLELLTISLLGLSAVSIWAGWQLEQTLIAGHKHTLDYIATRFPEQLVLHIQDQSLERGIGRTIEKVSAPGLVVWVKGRRGDILGHSSNFDPRIPEARLARSLSRIPDRPQVIHFQNYQIVLCATPLAVNGEPVGELYLSRDITAEQRQWQASVWQLLVITALVALLLVWAIAARISQAVTPLRQMSEVAAAVSADDLQAARLELDQAPAEVSGLALAFNAMLARLAVSWEQQREFMGNVSHELRTPLTVVSGYLQSLQRRSANLQDDQRQALATALAETERASRLLADLLQLARADSGQLLFESRPTRLHVLLAECVAMGQQVSRRPIHLQLPEEDVVVAADPERLQQVLLNLIDNAVKYSPATAPIAVSLNASPNNASIQVQDRGIGIPLSHQQRIFERFYRVSEGMTRGRDGTGLGLAIAKVLVEAMDGTMTVRSSPGEGSLFTITLPRWRL
jgi:signal transduction histidine kinase